MLLEVFLQSQTHRMGEMGSMGYILAQYYLEIVHWFDTVWSCLDHPTILQYVPRTTKVQSIEDLQYDRDRVRRLLLDNLTKARDCMKIFADRHQSERHIEIGDMVLLKLQPYKQATARGAMPHKLTLKYFGPHLIIEKIGNVAYHLQFPPSVKIHNVFHVS